MILKTNNIPSDVKPSDTEVQTVTKTGLPARRRVVTAKAAWDLFKRLRDAYGPTEARRSIIQGQVDGNPPYSSKKLRELGMGYRTNVNFLEMRAMLDTAAGLNMELYSEVPALIELSPLVADPEQTGQLNIWAGIIAEEFSRMVLGWVGFHPNMDLVGREADKFGLGVMFWQDEFDWRPKAFETCSFYTTNKAKFDLDKLDVFCLRRELDLNELLDSIDDENVAKEEGWNVPFVKKLLVTKYFNAQDNANTDDVLGLAFNQIQHNIRNYDTGIGQPEFEGLKVIDLLVKETSSGKITHLIIPEDNQFQEFIYEMPNRFESMTQTLWLLPYNYGNGYIRSAQGLATMIQPHCDLSNKFLCGVFDAGQIASSLVLQPKSVTDMSKLQIVRLGPFTYIPSDVSVIQSTFAPQVSPMIQLRNVSSDIMRNNTGVYRPLPESILGDAEAPKSARQVAQEASKEARYEKHSVVFKYNAFDLLYREMYRRATSKEYLESSAPYGGQKEAKLFVERCIARGVPEELIYDSSKMWVNASRAIGLGSLSVRLDITNQLMSARGAFDEIGKTIAVREWLAARVGYRNVDKFKSPVNRDAIPTNEWSIATLENNDFNEGSVVPVGVDQDHIIHFKIHASLIPTIAQAYDKSLTTTEPFDYFKALGILDSLLPHMQTTLQFIAQDPAYSNAIPELEAFLKKGLALRGVFDSQAKKLLKAQAKAQEEQAQTVADAEQTIADREHELKMQKMILTQNSLNGMREEKTAAQLELSKQKTAAGIELDAKALDARLALDRMKVEAEIARANTKGEK